MSCAVETGRYNIGFDSTCTSFPYSCELGTILKKMPICPLIYCGSTALHITIRYVDVTFKSISEMLGKTVGDDSKTKSSASPNMFFISFDSLQIRLTEGGGSVFKS